MGNGGDKMPFKKQKDGTYRSPSGRKFTASQVKAYYAKKKRPKKMVNKLRKD